MKLKYIIVSILMCLLMVSCTKSSKDLSTIYAELRHISVKDVLEMQICNQFDEDKLFNVAAVTNSQKNISMVLSSLKETNLSSTTEDEKGNYGVINFICKKNKYSLIIKDVYSIEENLYESNFVLPKLDDYQAGFMINVDGLNYNVIEPLETNQVDLFNLTSDLTYQFNNRSIKIIDKTTVKVDKEYYTTIGVNDFSEIYKEDADFSTLTIIDSLLNRRIASVKVDKGASVSAELIYSELNLTYPIRKLYKDSLLLEEFTNMIINDDKTLYLGVYEFSDEIKLNLKKNWNSNNSICKISADGFYTTYAYDITGNIDQIIEQEKFENGMCYSNFSDFEKVFVKINLIEESLGKNVFEEYNVVVNLRTSNSSTEKFAIYRNLEIDSTNVSIDALLIDAYQAASFPAIYTTLELILVPKDKEYNIKDYSFNIKELDLNLNN